ncbi:MAG: class I adenylate-forming enzyme family protein, partial [Actinomycetes bacterium]
MSIEYLTASASERQQRAVAGGLGRRGVQPGDRVVVSTESCAAMLSAVLGALRVGVVPVVLNSALLPHERAALIADAEPVLDVTDAVLAELLEAEPVDLAPVPLARPMHYTSGTSGTPKGVWSGLLSEHDAQRLFDDEADLWGFDADDVHLVCSPLHHSAPIRFGGGTLLRGGSVVVPGKFDPAVICDAVRTWRPTSSFMVPSHLQRLRAFGALNTADEPGEDWSSFRLLAHAGEPCPDPLKRAAIEAFPADTVWEFYGSTEGQFTSCSSTEWMERPGTVGRARPDRSLSVDDDGTIWCAAPEFASFSYWRDAERTEAAWRTAPDTGRRAFTVGDLGRIDDAGYLWLDGRRDDLIISGGVNVYPAEVERVLEQMPGVEQVAVFGVPDERWGQMVCAAVVGEVAPPAVQDYARARLAAYKCPKLVVKVSDLPHTSTGKLQRSRVAAW